MKKQFIYDTKGKKSAVIILIDEWNEIKKKLKKREREDAKKLKSTAKSIEKKIVTAKPVIKKAVTKAAVVSKKSAKPSNKK